MPKHLSAALALFALLGAQVFGLQRGYLCLCTGEAVETTAPSCEADDHCSDHEHEHEGVPHGHIPIKVKHEAQGKVSSALQVHAPVLVAVLEFKDIIALSLMRLPVETAKNRPPPGDDANPPASLLVAECKVLLV